MTAPRPAPSRSEIIKRSSLTLALGTIGGILFYQLHFPLAFMIGALVAVTIAAVAGANVRAMPKLRVAMVSILGVMLGSAFRPDIIQHLGAWTVSLIWLVPLIAVTVWLGKLVMQRWAKLDAVTSYFASVPGGLMEMTMIGGAEGGDEKRLSMLHALRIVIVVLILPFWFRFTTGYISPSISLSFSSWPPMADLAILGVCALCGYPFARLCRLPAPQLTGAMLLSAAAHLSGLTQSSPPALLVATAQTIIGASLGARFRNTPVRFFARTFGIAFVLTLVMVAICVAVAGIVHWMTGLPFNSALLAFAPGGLAEMSLIALYLGGDTAYVAAHHIVRITMVVMLVPPSYKLLKRLFPRWLERPASQ
ncbi:AbrB family transcriptional regulator [Elstera cyanobacteriorum]|uniref:AbrB family transcriptional regulator n=1 Tax=Elstera cyanobacteriorum TaxID=2022747 RepID=UPI0023526FB3|nr:AbrB family transcriptional regulator [Elstera cyanobacteriorum]MCK6444508.1 AbrB family transcriptional regulator [Elstera cyanobacteriorum]